jgi:hypothetical protein
MKAKKKEQEDVKDTQAKLGVGALIAFGVVGMFVAFKKKLFN